MKYLNLFSINNKNEFINKLSYHIDNKNNLKKYQYKIAFIHDKKIISFSENNFFISYRLLNSYKNELINPFFLGKSDNCILIGYDLEKGLLNKIFNQKKYELFNIRESIGILDKKVAPYLTSLYSLVAWSRNNRFCSKCGKINYVTDFGHSVTCSNNICNNKKFPRIDPTVIMSVFYKDKILLARNKNCKKGLYSCLAGFCEYSESMEETVKRETYEEVGIKIKNISYVFSQFWPFSNNLMIGFTAEAINYKLKINNKEIEDAIWLKKSELIRLQNEKKVLLPKKYAIAYCLIKSWTEKTTFS